MSATGVRVGLYRPRHWDSKPRNVDEFDAKADALALLQTFGVPAHNVQVLPEPPGYYHPGCSAVLRLGPTILAHFGKPHPNGLKACDLKRLAVGFEVFLDRVPMPRAKGSARPLPNIPPFQPAGTLRVRRGCGCAGQQLTAKSADKAPITDAKVFDLYQGGTQFAGK